MFVRIVPKTQGIRRAELFEERNGLRWCKPCTREKVIMEELTRRAKKWRIATSFHS
jgi:hypothetical protein